MILSVALPTCFFLLFYYIYENYLIICNLPSQIVGHNTTKYILSITEGNCKQNQTKTKKITKINTINCFILFLFCLKSIMFYLYKE